MRARSLIASLFLLMCTAGSARCQEISFQRLTTRDGLLADGITALMQDSLGFLWVGTAEGLCRFDGLSFTNYRTTDGLPMNFVSCLGPSRRPPGALWVGTSNGGFARFEKGRFTHFLADSSHEIRSVNAVLEDHAGVVWIATTGGLLTLRGGNLSFAPDCRGRPFGEILREDGKGRIWVGDGGSLLVIDTDRVASIRIAPGFRPGAEITSLAFDGLGYAWAGTSDSLLVHVSDSGTVSRQRIPFVPLDCCTDIRGDLWLSSVSGLMRCSIDSSGRVAVNRYTEQNGLPTANLTRVLSDRESNLWFGTNGKGLIHMDNNPVLSFPIGTLPLNVQYTPPAVVRPGEHHAWVIAQGGLLEMWMDREGAWRNAQAHFSVGGNDVQPSSVSLAGDALLWIGFTNDVIGCYRVIGREGKGSAYSSVMTLRPGRELPAGKRMVFAVEPDATMWYSVANEGVYAIDVSSRPRILRHFTARDGLPDDEVRTIFRDRGGNIWFGGDHGGCSVLRGGDAVRSSLQRFRREDGLPDGHVRAFCQTDGGTLWIGTRDGGLAAYERGSFASYSIRDGLESNTVWSIAPGNNGTLWLGTAIGLQPFDCARCSGLKGSPPLRGPAVIACGSLGKDLLWMSTPEYWKVFDAGDPWRNKVPPSMHITAFQVNGTPYAPDSLMAFPHDNNTCTIEYVGICLSDQNAVRYQYRLPGMMDSWSSPTDHHAVTFAALEAGEYAFEVRAMNNEGVMSAVPAVLRFTILPPFWQRFWFRSLAIIAAGGALFLVYRYRVNRILELERTRNRIARDLHDEVGSTLSSIAYFAEALGNESREAGRPVSSKFLSLIAESSASARSAMAEIVWSLDPTNDSWERFSARLRRYAADLLESKNMRHVVEISGKGPARALSMEQTRNLWLLYKEIIANAVAHSRCSEVRILMEVSGKTITFEATDDGIGFDPEAPAGGNGLRNVRQRVGALGGTVLLESAPGKGTRWHIRFEV